MDKKNPYPEKDWNKITRNLGIGFDVGGPVPQLIALLQEKSEGMENPILVVECSWDEYEYNIVGFVRKTPAEKSQYKKEQTRRCKEQEQLKEEEVQKEIETLRQLAAKYPDAI